MIIFPYQHRKIRKLNKKYPDLEFFFEEIYLLEKIAKGKFLSDSDYQNYVYEFIELERTFSQPAVIHNKPEDYGLTLEDSVKIRIKYLRQQAKDLKDEYEDIKGQYMRGERPYGYITMNSLQEQIFKLSKSIYFNRQRLKPTSNYETFDIERIKQIPLNQITEILPSGFFRNNPFRNEKSPSNSLHWNKKNNTFMDFGSGKFGDAVDLYQAVNNCDFKTACKELSNL